MKNDLSNLKTGDKIWTIEKGWEKVLSTDYVEGFPIETLTCCFALDGRKKADKFPSAFTAYPFGIEIIKKDTLVYYRDSENHHWGIGYYSHFENGQHFVINGSKKSTEECGRTFWNIVTTENPFL